jgi:hypothetical protein
MSSPSFLRCFDEYVVSRAFVYPNPMRCPLQHHINAPLSHFTSVWHRSKPHGATESTTQSRSRPFSWTRNISGILPRRDRSDIQLQEVGVPCTAGKPVRFSLSHFLVIIDSSYRRTTTRERRNQLPAHLDIPILRPRNNPAEQHKAPIIITATTPNYYCLATFCCLWGCWGNRNSFAFLYHWCWVARLFRGLDLLNAHSERRRSPLAKLHIGFSVLFVFCCLVYS